MRGRGERESEREREREREKEREREGEREREREKSFIAQCMCSTLWQASHAAYNLPPWCPPEFIRKEYHSFFLSTQFALAKLHNCNCDPHLKTSSMLMKKE